MRLRVGDAGTVDARGGWYERQQGGRSKAAGAMYGLGMFGALVLLAAGGFVLGVPPLDLPGDLLAAFMVYEVFETSHRLNRGRGGGLDA
jgi:hypothetical protein